jgi:hypothetical protein
MKIVAHGPAVANVLAAALVMCLPLSACHDAGRESARTQADTAVAPARTPAPAPVEAATPPPADPSTAPSSVPVKTDAQILSRVSSMAGMLSATANKAQGRSTNPDVLHYATTLLTTYADMANRFESISARMITEPKAAPGDSTEDAIRRVLELLQDAPDGKVDAIFMAQVIAWQRAMVADLGAMETTARNQELRTMIHETVPDVRARLDEGLRIQSGLPAR